MAPGKASKAEQRARDMDRRVGILASFALMVERRGGEWTDADHVRLAVNIPGEVTDEQTGADAGARALVDGARRGLQAAAAFALAGNPDGAAEAANWAAGARDLLAVIPAPKGKAFARQRGWQHKEATMIAAAAQTIADKSRRDENVDNPL